MSSKDHKTHNEQVSNQKECEDTSKIETKEDKIVKNAELSDSDNKKSDDPRVIELEEKILLMKKNEREILLRAQADIENIRKRTEQDIEKAHKFALEKFANELLPVIDNLERAIELIDRNQLETIPMLEGIELTLKSFLAVIHKFGIQVIEDKNISFNPDLHQAVTMIKSEKYEPNQIIDIMQKGYTLNGRLLRPAMVVVAKQTDNE